MEAKKKCTRCGKTLPRSEFVSTTSYCKTCWREWERQKRDHKHKPGPDYKWCPTCRNGKGLWKTITFSFANHNSHQCKLCASKSNGGSKGKSTSLAETIAELPDVATGGDLSPPVLRVGVLPKEAMPHLLRHYLLHGGLNQTISAVRKQIIDYYTAIFGVPPNE